MDTINLAEQIQILRGRPILKEPLAFFEYKQDDRIFLTITDSPQVWRDDLCITEAFFANMVICPFQNVEQHDHQAILSETYDILKLRMKYPGVKENPVWEQLAKTWVLPTKITLGPDTSCFERSSSENSVRTALQPMFDRLTPGETKLQFVKIELPNGAERSIIFKILDECFRPSLFLIKWSNDLDEHIPTASCAAYLQGVGYCLLALEHGYAFYMFKNDPLFDICSFKTVGLTNPILASLLNSVSNQIKPRSSVTDTSNSSPAENSPLQ